MRRWLMFCGLFVCVAALLAPVPAEAARKGKKAKTETEEKAEDKDVWSSGTFSGLKLRHIGPALTSGRISEIAVEPGNSKVWYVAVSSGGVWKTENAGTTFKPVFDGESSYSIGTVTIDPSNPNVVWVGTGENNSQRSVGYGDGVYKSVDRGKSWKNVGLKESEHIGKIIVHPDDSNVVYVAAQGPLWGPGGDRGVYKTTDGGETWTQVLEISENTGASDLVMDPRDPDVLYASAYQRRRRVWTLINGGPESAIYKTADGGENWTKLSRGLPKGDVGRIGLAISPVEPDKLYAVIEAAEDAGGFFRSIDGGASWEKRSKYVSGSPQYYQEIIADPHDGDRVYSNDTWLQVTEDGGKSFRRVGERFKHVDNHSLWIDPDDPDHLIAGCDGGIYETFDRTETWNFKANLSITQFYKIEADNDFPFYNVYGGTQDNFTLGGPARTTKQHGIENSDWFVTRGGDGFQTRVDPENPDILYSQSQYGGLVRYDRKSGERTDIRPHGELDEALRWNWDSALIISPHLPTRLYFAAQRLFRSDDRGDSWTAVSPDLTRDLDRNRLPVMGRIWGVDSVSKNRSTSFYGTIVALSESPLVEGLLYVGTDDGLVQVSEDGGENWRKIDSFPGVPERTYVNRLEASLHDADTVYAAFNNHKSADFKPYVLKSTDRGATWTSISGDLPERGSVYSLAEDGENPDLLFAGTEFGLFVTLDGGGKWMRLKSGLPTVAVRDLAIQRRENDLVVGTFGRGFYVLDDYTPLRHASREAFEQEAVLFPAKDAWMYFPEYPLGMRGKAFQGDSYFIAPNPPFGAVFTYYLKEGFKTRKEKRREEEKKIAKEGGDVLYPSWEDLRAEDLEEKPAVELIVRDDSGAEVRRVAGKTGKGIHRVAWDLRYPASNPVRTRPFPTDNPFFSPPTGPMAVPGTYTVELVKRIDGVETLLAGPESFETTPLGTATLPAADKAELLAFQKQTARLQRAVLGASNYIGEVEKSLGLLAKALARTPNSPPALDDERRALDERLEAIKLDFFGDSTIRRRSEPVPLSVVSRVWRIVGAQWSSSSAPTGTSREALRVAGEAFAGILARLHELDVDYRTFEAAVEDSGAPATPGRLPRWKPEG